MKGLRTLGYFSKVLITVFFGNFTAFNINTIYNIVKIRPKGLCNFVFCNFVIVVSFSKRTIFSSFSVFSVKLGFAVSKNTYFR